MTDGLHELKVQQDEQLEAASSGSASDGRWNLDSWEVCGAPKEHLQEETCSLLIFTDSGSCRLSTAHNSTLCGLGDLWPL